MAVGFYLFVFYFVIDGKLRGTITRLISPPGASFPPAFEDVPQNSAAKLSIFSGFSKYY